jgi:cysteine desulfurase/selenocysteine lyase
MQAATKYMKKSGDIKALQKEFPMLAKRVNRKPFIYFDNAATGHKAKSVIDRLDFYLTGYGKPKEKHELSQMADGSIEEVRKIIARFIGNTTNEIDALVSALMTYMDSKNKTKNFN